VAFGNVGSAAAGDHEVRATSSAHAKSVAARATIVLQPVDARVSNVKRQRSSLMSSASPRPPKIKFGIHAASHVDMMPFLPMAFVAAMHK
jgi:hypothetical protein